MSKKRRVPKSFLKKVTVLLDAVSDSSNEIKDGDIVRINAERVSGSQNFHTLNPKYREFILGSDGMEFTARVYERESGGKSNALIELEEAPLWLFWRGDLELVRRGGEENRD